MRIHKLIAKIFIFTALLGATGLFAFASTASAATFEFSPTSASYPAGCQRTLEIYVDVTGETSNAADLIFNYNADQVTVQNVLAGEAYQTFYSEAPQVNGTVGSVRMTAFSVSAPVTSRLIFARINFTSAPDATTATFTIQAVLGNTLDSNIADTNTSQDILTSVTNGSYTFQSGACLVDLTPPTITFVSPTSGQPDFPLNSPIQVRLEDAGLGIDISSMLIIINGVSYTSNSPGVSITGNPQNYLVTIQPAEPLPGDAASSIAVSVSDYSANNASRQNIFNVPGATEPGEEEPEEPGEEPAETPTTVPDPVVVVIETLINSPISFINTPFAGTIVEQVFQELGTAGTLATLSLAVNILPLLALLNAPGLIFNLITIFFGFKPRRPWGLVLDRNTERPIPYAVCRVFIAGSLTLLAQTVSDSEGRYGFSLASGRYRLEVSAQGYVKFVGEIVIREGESTYVMDVKLSKGVVGVTVSSLWRKLFRGIGKVWVAVSPYVFIFGFVLAIVNLALNPNGLSLFIFGFYIFIIVINLLAGLNLKSRNAAVIDSQTQLRIPNAVVKIFELNKGELVDTQVTNESGFFDYYGAPGRYAILVAARGYTFPAREAPQRIAEKYKTMLEVYLSKGGNKIQLWMDPIAGDSTESSKAAETGGAIINLPNPFA
jgi:hypothetical protein